VSVRIADARVVMAIVHVFLSPAVASIEPPLDQVPCVIPLVG
jgi:hypothetical protein